MKLSHSSEVSVRKLTDYLSIEIIKQNQVVPPCHKSLSKALSQVGMRRLCRHNFGHNRYVWESGIMLAFSSDYKALTVGKSADCTIPLKKIKIL